MAEQPETKLQRQIVKALNELPGVYFEKRHGSPFGKPTVDLTGIVGGRRAEIEVKVPKKVPTPRQMNTLRLWAKHGAITGWCTSVDEAREIIQPYLEKRTSNES